MAGPPTLAAGLAGSVLAGLGMGLGYSVVSVTMLAYAEPGREGLTASSLSLTDVLGAALATGIGGAFIALGDARGWDPRGACCSRSRCRRRRVRWRSSRRRGCPPRCRRRNRRRRVRRLKSGSCD